MTSTAVFQIVDGMAFLGCALLLSVWHVNRSPILKWWSGAYFVGGCGIALMIWWEWRNPWLSFGLGASMVLVAYGMMWRGLRTQSARLKHHWWALFPALLWTVVSPIPLLQGSELLRMIVFSPIAALCMCAIAWEALRLPQRPAARWPLIGTSLIYAVFYLIRTLSLSLHEGEAVHQFWLYATAIEAIAFIFCDAFLVTSLARAQREDQLAAEAQGDFLTGALNRRGFTRMAEKRRRHPPFSLLLLDVDHFKSVNDRLGHAVGDDLLRELGRCCLESVRHRDLVGRWGGDEFVLLISGPPDKGAIVADRIRTAFQALAQPYGSSVSIGIVNGAPGDARSLEELLEAADRDLYRAKANRPLAQSGSF